MLPDGHFRCGVHFRGIPYVQVGHGQRLAGRASQCDLSQQVGSGCQCTSCASIDRYLSWCHTKGHFSARTHREDASLKILGQLEGRRVITRNARCRDRRSIALEATLDGHDVAVESRILGGELEGELMSGWKVN